MPEEKAFKVKKLGSSGPLYLDPNANEAEMLALSVPDASLRLHGGKGPSVIIETNGEEIDLVKHIKTTRALVWGLFVAMVPLALAVVLLSFRLS